MTDYSYAQRFQTVYPALAQRILAETGVTRGRCLDLGSGPGYQGLALAERSDLEVWLLDLSAEALGQANHQIQALGLETRVRALQGDACALPLPDGGFDLVVSRGSIDFWERPDQGLREAWRVLNPGGWAWIGGGFGSVDQRMEINRHSGDEGATPETLRNPGWLASVVQYRAAAEASGLDYRFIDDNAGIWIVFQKPAWFVPSSFCPI